MMTAKDYGRFTVTFTGPGVKFTDTMDYYSPELDFREYGLGNIKFEAGVYTLEFVALDNNPAAVDGNMLGLDRIELISAD